MGIISIASRRLALASIALAGAAGAAAAVEPGDLLGQWGIGSADACTTAETMIFAASDGWASTREGSADRIEAVGTWAMEGGTDLALRFSEVLSPALVQDVVFGVELGPDGRITLASDMLPGGELALYRCPD